MDDAALLGVLHDAATAVRTAVHRPCVSVPA
jgi:hypothetical protein